MSDQAVSGRSTRGDGAGEPDAAPEGARRGAAGSRGGARGGGARGGGKSADAFRTISEVSEELEVPQHVLRFWETKFAQVRPLKRGGGRRYYRPGDIELLRRIRDLLYGEGYTIKGVQKLLRETKGEALPTPVTERARGELDSATRRELAALRDELAALRDELAAAVRGRVKG